MPRNIILETILLKKVFIQRLSSIDLWLIVVLHRNRLIENGKITMENLCGMLTILIMV
nr:MAG TPA: hypothetical protein [Caudoviricetes sp.]